MSLLISYLSPTPRPSDFANANLDIVDALSLAEAIELVGGVGFWNTAAVPGLGIPTIKVSNIGGECDNADFVHQSVETTPVVERY